MNQGPRSPFSPVKSDRSPESRRRHVVDGRWPRRERNPGLADAPIAASAATSRSSPASCYRPCDHAARVEREYNIVGPINGPDNIAPGRWRLRRRRQSRTLLGDVTTVGPGRIAVLSEANPATPATAVRSAPRAVQLRDHDGWVLRRPRTDGRAVSSSRIPTTTGRASAVRRRQTVAETPRSLSYRWARWQLDAGSSSRLGRQPDRALQRRDARHSSGTPGRPLRASAHRRAPTSRPGRLVLGSRAGRTFSSGADLGNGRDAVTDSHVQHLPSPSFLRHRSARCRTASSRRVVRPPLSCGTIPPMYVGMTSAVRHPQPEAVTAITGRRVLGIRSICSSTSSTTSTSPTATQCDTSLGSHTMRVRKGHAIGPDTIGTSLATPSSTTHGDRQQRAVRRLLQHVLRPIIGSAR